jgi:SAM-dependent methyltransferase
MVFSQSSPWMKVRRILASQGIGGVFEELATRLKHGLSRRAGLIPYHVFRTRDWDRRRGVETDEPMHVRDLPIDSPSREHATYYLPTTLWTFRDVMVALRDQGIRPSEFSLVDLGCGKGRVLLMAVEAGFNAVIGVEFAPELVRIAMDNIRSCRGRRRRPTIYCTDAATFPIPMGPVVLFIFNPFKGPVLEAVADNIKKSFSQHVREMLVVYLVPQPESPFDRGAPFVKVDSGQDRAIYRLIAAPSH